MYIFNESEGNTELRLRGNLLKSSPRRFSREGTECGGKTASALGPQVPPQHFCSLAAIKTSRKFAVKTQASGHQL